MANDVLDGGRHHAFHGFAIESLARILGVQWGEQRARPRQASGVGRQDSVNASLHGVRSGPGACRWRPLESLCRGRHRRGNAPGVRPARSMRCRMGNDAGLGLLCDGQRCASLRSQSAERFEAREMRFGVTTPIDNAPSSPPAQRGAIRSAHCALRARVGRMSRRRHPPTLSARRGAAHTLRYCALRELSGGTYTAAAARWRTLSISEARRR
jgi:hypothetical protein